MAHLDPYAYAFHEDPYPFYAELRERAPVYHNEELGFWALSRHADVFDAFKNPRRFSNAKGVSMDPASWGPQARLFSSFLAMDPPEHTRMRGLVARGFTPRRVAALEPRIREIAVAHLDALVGSGGFDVIDEFAGKLPMDVISEMLGVPEADRAMLRTWADLLVHREEGTQDVPAEGVEAFGRIRGYFKDLLAERRKRPGDDLLSALLVAETGGDRLDDNELLSFCNLMIVAGNETTTKLIANALYWLWRSPEQRARVRRDAACIPGWVEETLRYDNSTQILARLATEEFELRGVTVPEGVPVLLLVGSANRDEEVFPRAEVFDLERDTSEMLSFGRGTHFCMGASLARLEGRVALEEWWSRFGDYEIEPEGAVRVHSSNVRGFARLPVKV
ncbi:MAG: cytochrome P450 [Myxococcota bacterium]